ncbi:RICIN domain-containing protein [Actinomadura oligospora]|uniref:RICIN domain-containing protein n=1 Tax=Actinomadura oligospora TaxID=111804 RepID=UPI0004BCF986|nr:RICIN domain-containing protein [Actinomadura oligospora]
MRRFTRVVLLPTVVMLGGLWAVSSASAASSARPASQRLDEGVLIKPLAASGQCLEVADANTGNGALVTLWPCRGTANQRWIFDARGRIKSGLPGEKCLDVRAGNGGNGAAINLYDCNSASGQQWHVAGNRLISGVNNHCLTAVAANYAGGGAIVNWECVAKDEQDWRLS